MNDDDEVMRDLARMALLKPKATTPKKPPATPPQGVVRGGYVLLENVAERRYIVREISSVSRSRAEVSLNPDEGELINRRSIPFSVVLFASSDLNEVRKVAGRLNRASARYRNRQKKLKEDFLEEFQGIIGKLVAPV